MNKVRFYDIKRTKSLAKIERRINKALKSTGNGKCAVRLFATADGQIGYSVRVVPAANGRKDLNVVHRVVCQIIGYKRGRPPGTPTHQVKCRIPKETYRRLVQQAKKRHLPPSRLASELLTQQVGAQT